MRVPATKHLVGRYVPPEPGQRGIMRGAEQLQLFDSPVSGMVLATREGAQQECNRPDQCGSVVITVTAIWAFCFLSRPRRR